MKEGIKNIYFCGHVRKVDPMSANAELNRRRNTYFCGHEAWFESDVSRHVRKKVGSFTAFFFILGLRHLEHLDLAGNDLASMWLQASVFGHLPRLRSIDLSANRLTELEQGLLAELSELERLDLSGNQISRLSRAPFQNQTKLQFLSLSHNSISSLDATSLQGLTPSLELLRLDHNQLKLVHRDGFRNLTGLLRLLLNHNHLETVPTALQHLSELTELDLSENEVSELNSDFMLPGSKLTILTLEGNRIERILSDTFNSTRHLQDLNLARNQLSALHQAAFSPLSQLVNLTLAENKLTDINGVLTSHPALLRLNLSHNELKWFDMAFFPRQLEVLEVQSNHIEEIGNYYKLLDGFKLRTLDAGNNRISVLGHHTFVVRTYSL